MSELTPRYHWVVPEAHPLSEATIEDAKRRGLSARALRVLSRRGPVDPGELASRFDAPEAGLHDPSLLPDAALVRARVASAREAGESVLVLGDFDADGLTGLAILSEALGWLGITTEPYVPDRSGEGHGLSLAAVEHARAAGHSLIITADTGSGSVGEVAAARSAGIDVIVTDHHVLGEERPDAVALVNAQRPDNRYPDRRLSGAGVAFKVAQLLLGDTPDGAAAALGLADLAAIGSVADVVPIVGENRSIVRLGLARLEQDPRPGLAALMARARVDRENVSTDDISFGLAPRINAMGRIGDPSVAARLLLAPDDATAVALAGELESANLQRRELTASAMAEARQALAAEAETPFIVLVGDWPVGIIGLVAGRLSEEHGRPALVLSSAVDPWRGSARSAGGVDLASAFASCSDLFERFGGHPAAAGCHLEPGHLEELRSRLDAFVRERPPADARASLSLDLVQSADDADYVLLRELAPLEGAGDAPPLVGIAGLAVNRVRTANGGHTQLTLRRGREVVDGICFGRADLAEQLTEGSENRRRRTTRQPHVRGPGDAPARGPGCRSGRMAARDAQASDDETMTQPPLGPPPGGGGYSPDAQYPGPGYAPPGHVEPGSDGPPYLPPLYPPGQEPIPPRRPRRSSPVVAPLLALIGLALIGGASLWAVTQLDGLLGDAAATDGSPEPSLSAVLESAPPGETEAPGATDPPDGIEAQTLEPEGPEPTAEPIVVIPPSGDRADVVGTILFTRLGDVWAASGTTLTPLSGSSSEKADSSPTWSPDGKQIYFVRTTKRELKDGKARYKGKYTLYPNDLMRMRADGSKKTMVFESLIDDGRGQWFIHLRQPSVSSNGTNVAVVADGNDGGAGEVTLHIINSRTGRMRPVDTPTEPRFGHNNPDFSPDGKKIAFTYIDNAGTEGDPKIAIFSCKSKADCSKGKTRYLRSGYANPSWSPDGSLLAVEAVDASGRDIAIITAKGAERVRLTTGGDSFAPAFSPAGDQIAYLRRDGLNIDLRVITLDIDERNKITLVEDRAVTSDGQLDGESGVSWFIPRSQLRDRDSGGEAASQDGAEADGADADGADAGTATEPPNDASDEAPPPPPGS